LIELNYSVNFGREVGVVGCFVVFRWGILGTFYSELHFKTKCKIINLLSLILISSDSVEVKSILWKFEGVIQFLVMKMTDVKHYDVSVDCIWFDCSLQVNIS